MDDRLYNYKGKIYPSYLKSGNAARFIEPYGKELCKGVGLDIGGVFNWYLPGAKAINIFAHDNWDAYNLPAGEYDYIFSSHTLEHLPNPVKALEYWKAHIKPGGVLFLYLPHPDMEYWLPQNDRKHLHVFHPEDMKKLLLDLGFENVLASERDLYWSYSVVGFEER